MSSGSRRTDDVEADAVADAIRAYVSRAENLDDGRHLRHVVLVTQTEAGDGSAARTQSYYPMGVPDVATELAMLERARDALRRHGQ